MPKPSEEKLFAQAIELPLEERAAFLAEACGNDEALRAGIEGLLEGHESFSEVLDVPLEEREGELSKVLSEATAALSVTDPNPVSTEKALGDFGDYVIEKELARGAMGIVYQAEHTRLKRTVALKMIRSTMLANAEEVARFKAEAEAAASLDHPNIVPIYEIGESEGQHFFTMKLIEGGILSNRTDSLRENPEAAAKLIATVARAIHAAHQRGILHRDIKPGNILIDEEGEPHVTDFGLAKQMESNSSMTLSGQIMGTPYYMAPEQAQGGAKALTTEADIYSLGAVLYELLTGRQPHKGESLMDTLKLVVQEDPVAPRTVAPSVDRDLETIVLKCLEKDPKKRYSSATGLADELDRWLAGEPILARPAGSAEKVVKWMRRKPALAALWIVGLLFLLTLGIGGPIIAFRQAELREDAERQRDNVYNEQLKTEKQRMKADDARRVAQAATKLEAKARREAQKQAQEIRHLLYFSEMDKASRAAAEPGGIRRMREVTASWVPEADENDLRGWEWHYLDRLARYEVSSYSKHRPAGYGLCWSRRGNRVASSGTSGDIRIWNADSGTDELLIQGHEVEVSAVAWSPDDFELVSVDGNGQVVFWNTQSGEERLSLHVEEKLGSAIAWKPDGLQLAIGCREKEVRILSTETGEVIQSLPVGAGRVESVAWSPDGSRFAAGSDQDKGTIWETGRDGKLRLLTPAPLRVFDWSPDGTRLANGSGDHQIQIIESKTGAELRRLGGHIWFIKEVSWSPDGNRIASASWDQTIGIWDPEGYELPLSLPGFDKLYHVSWSPGSDRVAFGTSKVVSICDVQSAKHSAMGARGHWIDSLRFSPDGTRLASGSGNQNVRIWNAASGAEERVFRGHSVPVTDLAWAPDGSSIASAADEIIVWNARTGEKRLSLVAENGFLKSVGWSPDGSRLATLGSDDAIRIWDAGSGNELDTLAKERLGLSALRFVAWSPDGKMVAVGSFHGRINLFETEQFTLLRSLNCKEGSVTTGVWSPDGRAIAIAHESGRIEILGVEDNTPLVTMAHDADVFALAWSPDGSRLASGGLDRRVRVWETRTGLVGLTLSGHGREVKALSWSSDGSRLASGGADQTIRIWDGTPRDDPKDESSGKQGASGSKQAGRATR